MPLFKFDQLALKNGDHINCGSLNVIVGANNSGKTTLLKEIADASKVDDKSANRFISDLTVDFSAIKEDPNRFFKKDQHPNSQGIWTLSALSSDLNATASQNVNKEALQNYLDGNDDENVRPLIERMLGNFMTAYMSAESRLDISKRKPAIDYRTTTPTNVLAAFYASWQHAIIKDKLCLAFKEAFDTDIVFDYSRGVNNGFKVGHSEVERPVEPRELGDFLEQNKFRELDTEGDGYRSFVSTVLGLLTSAPKVLLLDEPEAFLHQAQAEMLGRLVANLSREFGLQVFVATHSAPFLWGLLKEDPKASIFRVTRRQGISRVSHITPEAIGKIFENPMLATQKVLESLFFDKVIVCEGDSDRLVYDYALTKFFEEKNLMVNSTVGKQNAVKVAKFARDLGALSVAIVDIDFLNDEGDVDRAADQFELGQQKDQLLQDRKLLEDEVGAKRGNVSEEMVRSILTRLGQANPDKTYDRSKVRRASNDLRNASKGWEAVKSEGVSFWEENQAVAIRTVSTLKKLGIFICEDGELEQWFPNIQSKKKSEFSEKAIRQLDEGSIPEKLKVFLQEVVSFFERN